MPAHAVRPQSKSHLAGFGGPMTVKPGQDRLGLLALRNMVSGKIGEPRIIAEHHAAMALAVPQTGLLLDHHVIAVLLGEQRFHMGDQHLATGASIGAEFLRRRKAASRAKNHAAHLALSVTLMIASLAALQWKRRSGLSTHHIMIFKKLAFVASEATDAQKAFRSLVRKFGNADPAEADAIIALGGDGLMLQALHRYLSTGKPIYGMNRGSVGFLMNDFSEKDLLERINAAELTMIHPLRMEALDGTGQKTKGIAFNEVSFLRQRHQAAKLKISIDGKPRLDELICDGILLSTPAGSTAYNLSAHGPILPINAPLLALTPISAFRPRRWRGAILPREARVTIEILEADKRPVAAVADHIEVRNVQRVDIAEDRKRSARILFDKGQALAERVLVEQFRF